jgi:hypothetical protein
MCGNIYFSRKTGDIFVKPYDGYSEEQQINYVKKYYENIKDITNPSIVVQLAAVQYHGNSIRFLFNPIENAF